MNKAQAISHTKTIQFFLLLFAYLLKTIGVLGETRLVQYVLREENSGNTTIHNIEKIEIDCRLGSAMLAVFVLLSKLIIGPRQVIGT